MILGMTYAVVACSIPGPGHDVRPAVAHLTRAVRRGVYLPSIQLPTVVFSSVVK